VVVEVDGGTHERGSCEGEAVSTGTGYFGDEAMRVKQLDEARDACALALAFVRVFGISDVEMGREVTVAEAVDEVFAAQCGGEESDVVLAQGIESPTAASVFGDGFADLVEEAVGLGRIVYGGQGVEVGAVGTRTDLGVAIEVANALGHGIPADDGLAPAFSLASDAKLVGMIDDCFDTQYAPVFVVHFDPVAFHPVFHARSRPTLLEVVRDLALEVPVEFSTEEGQDILGAEAHGGVPQQVWIQVLESGAVFEQDVGSVFGLVNNPVVMHALQEVLQQGVDLAGKGFEDRGEVLLDEAVGKALGAGAVVDTHEGVFDLDVSDPVLGHFSSEPLVAVQIDLERKWKPSLKADVHEAEFAVDVVEVQAQTARRSANQARFSLPVLELETLGGFYNGEYAHEALADAVALSDIASAFVFANGCIEIGEKAANFSSELVGVLLEQIRTVRGETLEILEEDPVPVEKGLHALGIIDGQVSLEQNSIETGNRSRNLVLMLYNELVQGVSLPWVVCSTPVYGLETPFSM
jgi:hypothetical protein